MMLLHGIAKVQNPGIIDHIGSKLVEIGLPAEVAYGVYLGEVLGPILVIIGLMTRLGALMMTVNMIVAIALMHTAELTQLTQHGGWALELQGFYLFGSLAILAMGSGRWALSRS